MAPKKASAPAPKEVKTAVPETAPVVVKKEEVVEVAPVAPTTETVEVDKFAAVIETLQKFQNEIKDILSVVKTLQKDYGRLLKTSSKKSKKAGGASADGTKRQPSGFAKPTQLSNQLCDFLGVAHNTSMARTEVTRMINEYIKTNKLQDSSDKRKIVPDAKLKSILKIDEGTVLSYFNLQSHLKGHFTKAATATA